MNGLSQRSRYPRWAKAAFALLGLVIALDLTVFR